MQLPIDIMESFVTYIGHSYEIIFVQVCSTPKAYICSILLDNKM